MGEDRDNDFVARFSVVVQQRKSACVCLHEKPRCGVERAVGMFAKEGGLRHSKLVFNVYCCAEFLCQSSVDGAYLVVTRA